MKIRMKNRFILILALSFFIISCNSIRQTHSAQEINTITTNPNNIVKSKTDSFTTTEVICDSIYKNKKFKIVVSNFSNETSYEDGIYNAIFHFFEFKNGRYREIFSDSIQRHFDQIKFADFNKDNVKDILIENIADVRSNLTYNLYLIDTLESKLKKIKGFETIKNPNFLPIYNLIDNYVLSGQNWTSFYKIEGDSIKDYEIIIFDNQTDDGSYDQEYNRALNSILSQE